MNTDGQQVATEPTPHRAGAVWSPQDSATLLDGLRAGIPLADLAETLQRRPRAIQRRCKLMLPPEMQTGVPRAEADLVLREQLVADPDFDVEANLDRNTSRKWNTERDDILTQGWDQRDEMAELVDAATTPSLSWARMPRLPKPPSWT